jgi:DNA polymerase-4/DNA polymerase V
MTSISFLPANPDSLAQADWPEAIMHCDADAFFLGCELMRRPDMKGKPAVVTGKLGGIVLAKSYDLKAKGVHTGMPIWEARKICPSLMVFPADFQLYNRMSAKMFAVFNEWTPDVEVYSVDEAFLNVKGLCRLYKMDYEKMAYAIKDDVKKKLGITVSVGISVTKTLAKIASDHNKPDGVTVVSAKDIKAWLQKIPIKEVPGFGRNTLPLLEKHGIYRCADFVNLRQEQVRNLLHRPGVELWKELRGEKVYNVSRTFAANKSITRTSSFEPMTADQKFLWIHTVRQLERAIDALHREGLLGQEIVLYLRDQNFHSYSWAYRLATGSKSFSVFLKVLKSLWREHFPRGVVFRSTGIYLLHLSADHGTQLSLFENSSMSVRRDLLEQAKESIRDRYGNLSIRAASSISLKMLGPNRKNLIRARAFNAEW